MLSTLHKKRYICATMISLLLIVVFLFDALKSDEMVVLNGNCANHSGCLLSADSLGEISSCMAVRMDDIKEVSIAGTNFVRSRITNNRGFFLGLFMWLFAILFCFFISQLFYLNRVIRSNRLVIISYIHSLDGMKL